MEPPDPALWLCSLSPALICVPLNITWMCQPCKAIIGAGIVKLCSPCGSVDAESRGDNVHGCILPAVSQQGRHALSKGFAAQHSWRKQHQPRPASFKCKDSSGSFVRRETDLNSSHVVDSDTVGGRIGTLARP
ncbi:hypothetical protein Anapl_02647 [Anas platyrhynchos]|uniref:Uncharacterized protein n=1 Tax=Anas platyrhynchos TaxID=8839 RepID=R0JNE2_ANAPL|nr:hypothetical protein Anapl_02647 [Anas platyrhynchos]